RITVDEWEPAALDLNSDSVSLLEAVEDIGHRERYTRLLTRNQRPRITKATSVTGTHQIAAHQAVVARIRARCIRRIDINQLCHNIDIRAVHGYKCFDIDRTRDGHILGKESHPR
ncbi:MAG: hypothetical protein RJA02_2292, partial [Armatimonadota bacterium]